MLVLLSGLAGVVMIALSAAGVSNDDFDLFKLGLAFWALAFTIAVTALEPWPRRQQ